MEIVYSVIVVIVTYLAGAITKLFINKVPNKYIPFQNLLIGIISGLICYFVKIEHELVQSLILCILASTGAGGLYDLTKITKKEGE